MAPNLFDLYDAECRAHGRAPGRKYGAANVGNIHLAKDPEAVWPRVLPHVWHAISEYAKWAEAEAGTNSPFLGLASDEAALRRSGMFVGWTPEELLEQAAAAVGRYGSLSFMPLLGGMKLSEP